MIPLKWLYCTCDLDKKLDINSRSRFVTNSFAKEEPDLVIYSQNIELANNRIPTWDNPDIITNIWNPFRLKSEAKITIRNLSTKVPAIDVNVNFYLSDFGIGTELKRFFTKKINIPPSSNLKIQLPFSHTLLNKSSRIGLHVKIEHGKNKNISNKISSQVIDGISILEMGRGFEVDIPVFNNSNYEERISLSNYPSDLIISYSEQSLILSPYSMKNIKLRINVPLDIGNNGSTFMKRDITLIGKLLNGKIIGGVTILLRGNG